jgi:hypothetical protein
MMQRRAEIVCWIAARKSTGGMASNLHHNPKLIREIRDSSNTPSWIFTLNHVIRNPQTATEYIIDHVEPLTDFS